MLHLGAGRERATMSIHVGQVHYFSPFNSTTWLPIWQAESYLEQDDERWSRLEELEMVTDAQRAAGPPHIELER
jgi:hypothetical protein